MDFFKSPPSKKRKKIFTVKNTFLPIPIIAVDSSNKSETCSMKENDENDHGNVTVVASEISIKGDDHHLMSDLSTGKINAK